MQMKTWLALVGARSKLRSKGQIFQFCAIFTPHLLCAPTSKNCKKRRKWYTNHSSNKTNKKKFGSCWLSIFNNFLNIFFNANAQYIRGQIKVHAVRYAFLMCLLFAAPTSTHGVFTSFRLSQYCCLHFWKNKFGSMLAQGFLRVKSQAQITKVTFCELTQ